MKHQLAAVALSSVAVFFHGAVLAWEIRTSAEGVPLRWEAAGRSIPYFIESGGSDDLDDGSEFTAIQSAFQTWENVSTGSLKFEFLGPAERDALDENTSIVLWMEEEWPFDSKYVAMTRVFHDRPSGRIVKVQMMLNGRDYRWTTSGTGGAFDVQNVATHEVGHFIGLDDVATPASTMFEYITPQETEKRFLSDDELAALTAEYPLIAEGEEAVIEGYSISSDSHIVRSAGEGVVLEAADFLALCPPPGGAQPDGSFGLVRGSDDEIRLILYGPGGGAVRRYDIIAGTPFRVGRIQAVSTLDLNGDGLRAEIAAVISTPEGTSALLGALPGASSGKAEIRLSALALRGADDLCAFSPLGPGEGEAGGAIAAVEKRRNSDCYLSIARARLESPEEAVLERLRSWRLPGVTRVFGIAAGRSDRGGSRIAALAHGEGDSLEILLYDSPFDAYPADGAALEPTWRLDATALEREGRPLAFAAAGGSEFAVILAR